MVAPPADRREFQLKRAENRITGGKKCEKFPEDDLREYQYQEASKRCVL